LRGSPSIEETTRILTAALQEVHVHRGGCPSAGSDDSLPASAPGSITMPAFVGADFVRLARGGNRLSVLVNERRGTAPGSPHRLDTNVSAVRRRTRLAIARRSSQPLKTADTTRGVLLARLRRALDTLPAAGGLRAPMRLIHAEVFVPLLGRSRCGFVVRGFRFGFHATSRCAKTRATASGSRSITCRRANASDGIAANTEALGECHLRQVHAFAR
jgi:hypothetical protein